MTADGELPDRPGGGRPTGLAEGRAGAARAEPGPLASAYGGGLVPGRACEIEPLLRLVRGGYVPADTQGLPPRRQDSRVAQAYGLGGAAALGAVAAGFTSRAFLITIGNWGTFS
jgi:hypothetical protein